MDAKLTLKLDEKAIEQAKHYAGRHGVSVSRMVETYFLSLVERGGQARIEPRGIVAELAGILAGQEVDTSKEGRARYLARKHS